MTEIVKINAAEDIASLADFAAPIWHEHYDSITGSEQVDYMLEKFQSAEAMTASLDEGYSIYRVYEDGEPAGYFAICPHEDHMYLSKLYLRSDFRRRGLGRKMMDFVENEARKADFDKVKLNVNKQNGSIEAYRHLGFDIAYAEVNDIGEGYVMDDYVMEKTI